MKTTGVGEIGKFLSPEDKEALRDANRDIDQKKLAGDSDGIETAQRRRLGLKDEIRKRVEQEVYARAEKFGEILLLEAEKSDTLPFDQIREALMRNDASEMKDDYPEIVEALSGLSQEERDFFIRLIAVLRKNYLFSEIIENYAYRYIVNRYESLPEYPELVELMGIQVYEMINGKNSGKKLQGKVSYRNGGPFSVLEFTDYQDYLSFYLDSEDTVGDLSETDINAVGSQGHYDPQCVFFGNDGKEIGDNPFIAFFDPGGKGGIFLHEKGHYINWLVEESKVESYADRDNRWVEISENLSEIEAKIRNPFFTKKDLTIQKYRAELEALQKYFLSRAKDELLAQYQFNGNFHNITELNLKAKDAGKNSLYDYYDREFARRMPFIPEPLMQLIKESEKEYYRILEEQGDYLPRISNLFFDNQLPERYKRSFRALLRQTPIEQWKDVLGEIYSVELMADSDLGKWSEEFFDYFNKASDIAEMMENSGHKETARELYDKILVIIGRHKAVIEGVRQFANKGVPLKSAMAPVKDKIAQITTEMKTLYLEYAKDSDKTV